MLLLFSNAGSYLMGLEVVLQPPSDPDRPWRCWRVWMTSEQVFSLLSQGMLRWEFRHQMFMSTGL